MSCLVVTYDYSRFTWVLFLATKDETSGILKSFITGIENLVDHKVKVIRCDNGTEFKNREMNQFYKMKGILRQFSVARTPQQNGVAERRNKTLIEAARTMLADSKLPTTFWAEAVNTACYVQNRVLVVKPHNKTPYELFHGRTPTLSFMRPFGCPVTILNTIDHLGKFDGKADEGFFVGYSLNIKAFRVFNSRIRIVKENLHIRFSESTPNIVGSGLDWIFDIDALTRTMNYEPIIAGTQSNGFESTKASDNADPKSSHDDGSKPLSDDGKKVNEDPRKDSECKDQEKEDNVNSFNNVNTAGYSIFDFSIDDEDDGAVVDINNLDTTIQVSPNPTTRIHKYHPLDQVIGDFQSATQTRKMSTNLEEHGFMSSMGELTFFLGLQVQQKKDGIFISQDKYVVEILKKFRFTEVKTTSTPIETQKPLLKDEDGEEVDVHMYRSMIGSLMYLTSSRPDIMFVVCACARYQVNPKVKQKKSVRLMMDMLFGMELELILLHALVDVKKIIVTEASVRRDLRLEDEEGIDFLPNSTIFEQLALMGYEKVSQKLTFYKPFFSSQWKFLIHTILQCLSAKTTAWNKFSSTMASAIICLATNQKFNFSKFIFEGMIRNLDNLSRKFLMYPRFEYEKGGKGFSGRVTPLFPTMVVQNQAEICEGSTVSTDPHHTSTIIQPLTSQPQKTQKPRKPKRKDTQVPQPSGPTDIVADEAVYKELGDRLVRVATTASSLKAEQDSGNITKTRSKVTPNESSFLGTTSGGGPGCQETIRDTIAQTRFKNVSKLSNDSLLAKGNTLQSDEDKIKLIELMELCTNLQQRVLDLEQTKTSQQNEITSLKMKVKKLEQKRRSRTHRLKRLYKVSLTAWVESSDEDITLVNVQDDVDNEMFDVNALDALEALKTSKPKVQGIVFQEPEWDDIQAKVYADYQLVERLQAEEQEQSIIEEKATLILDKAFKRVNMFVDFRTELVEGSSKRAGTEIEQEVTKKKKVDNVQETAKVDNDQEAAKIKELMEIVPDEEEVAIDAISLAIKSPSIVDWKIHTDGNKRLVGERTVQLVKPSMDQQDLHWKGLGFGI
ncbi:ribonuclease H-like domain-containing protein [Tanacetum coccineum]